MRGRYSSPSRQRGGIIKQLKKLMRRGPALTRFRLLLIARDISSSASAPSPSLPPGVCPFHDEAAVACVRSFAHRILEKLRSLFRPSAMAFVTRQMWRDCVARISERKKSRVERPLSRRRGASRNNERELIYHVAGAQCVSGLSYLPDYLRGREGTYIQGYSRNQSLLSAIIELRVSYDKVAPAFIRRRRYFFSSRGKHESARAPEVSRSSGDERKKQREARPIDLISFPRQRRSTRSRSIARGRR